MESSDSIASTSDVASVAVASSASLQASSHSTLASDTRWAMPVVSIDVFGQRATSRAISFCAADGSSQKSGAAESSLSSSTRARLRSTSKVLLDVSKGGFDSFDARRQIVHDEETTQTVQRPSTISRVSVLSP